MREALLFVALLAVGAPAVHAQVQGEVDGVAEKVGYKEQAERFMKLVQEGSFRESIDVYFSTNPWMKTQPDKIATVKAQMSGLGDLLGEVHGYELIAEQRFGDSFVYLLYLAKFDRSPLSFHLSFYRPADKWVAYNMEYKEDIPPMARELAKFKLTMPLSAESQAKTGPQKAGARPL